MRRVLVGLMLLAAWACRDFTGAYDGYVERYDAWVKTQEDSGAPDPDAGGVDAGEPPADAGGGGCDAGLTDCGGQCVDVTNDTLHCGRCAHACGGAACAEARCQPITLQTDCGQLHWLALDDTYVYAAVANYRSSAGGVPLGRVLRTPKTGSSLVELAAPEAGPSIILVRSGRVYWTTWEVDDAGVAGSLRSVGINGGSAPVTHAVVDGGGGAFGLAVQGDELSAIQFSPPSLITLQLDGGGETRLALPGSQATNVLYVRDRRFVSQPDERRVLVVEADGGVAPFLTFVTEQPWGLASDGVELFVTDQGAGGRLLRVSVDGGEVGELKTALGQPRGVAVDDDYVYVAELTGNRIRAFAKDGGGELVLANGQFRPNCVVLDRDYVYWETEDGKILRVRKP